MRRYIFIIIATASLAFIMVRFAPRTHINNSSLNKSTVSISDKPSTAMAKKVVFEPYKKEAFNEALKSDQVIMLFFGANWCSTCALEYSSYSQMAHNYSGNKDLLIYYVHIEDDQVSEADKEIAATHNITSRSSKVLFYQGKKVIATASPWTSDKLLTELDAL